MCIKVRTKAAIGLAGREARTVSAAELGRVQTLHAAFLGQALPSGVGGLNRKPGKPDLSRLSMSAGI
jgi:hypothetical protein